MASYPEYSADFFDGEHFVMKGASPATARELLRPTFRNWFRAAVSLRLCDVPLRETTRRPRRPRRRHEPHDRRAVRGRRRATTCRRYAAPAAVALFLRRARVGAVRRDLRAAVVPHHARRDAPARRARRARSCARVGPLTTLVELGPGSGEKLLTLLESGAASRRSDSTCI